MRFEYIQNIILQGNMYIYGRVYENKELIHYNTYLRVYNLLNIKCIILQNYRNINDKFLQLKLNKLTVMKTNNN